MSEQDNGVNNVEATQQEPTDALGTSSPSANESEDTTQLEAQKAKLEAEIAGLEGTKKAILEDVVQARQERKDTTSIDVEALKAEVEASVLSKVSTDITTLKEELVKSKDSEISAKKALVESINARMASASGSSGQASSNSLVENEVELSNDEKEVAAIVGLKDPRYLKDVEVRGL